MAILPPIVWRVSLLVVIAAVLSGLFAVVLEPQRATFLAVIVLVFYYWVRGPGEPETVPQDKAIGTEGHDQGNFDPNRDWREQN